jgi:cytochrome c biogenesis protein CcmG/thiol:disulfide interchange protein DsbE
MNDDLDREPVSGHDRAGPEAAPGRPARSRLAPFVALGVAIVMIALIVLLIGADPDQNNSADSALLGRPAPEATGTLGSGEHFDLSRRKGSWVVLNFFRSDCVPCIQEHPELIEFVDQQRQLGSDGAEFYSVVTGDTVERVERFFAERGGDWPVIYSEADEFSVAFGVAAVPETWIIDPAGIVQERFISTVTAEFLSVTLQQYREAFAS